MIKELTCGCFGGWTWYNRCFNVSLNDQQLIVKVPFYKKELPITRIKKIESIKGLMKPRHLKLTYETSNQKTNEIKFFSVNPAAWFEAFDKLGVETEDSMELRNVKNHELLQCAKVINLSAGVIAAMAAAAALSAVLFGLMTEKL